MISFDIRGTPMDAVWIRSDGDSVTDNKLLRQLRGNLYVSARIS